MAPLPVGAGSAGGSTRVVFIDLLRGWAVVFMIETHVVNATLRADLRTTLFDALTFVNGLVAPSFIFASGLAYAITAHRKHAEYTTPGAPLARQLARLAFIVGLGYVLPGPVARTGPRIRQAGRLRRRPVHPPARPLKG